MHKSDPPIPVLPPSMLDNCEFLRNSYGSGCAWALVYDTGTPEQSLGHGTRTTLSVSEASDLNAHDRNFFFCKREMMLFIELFRKLHVCKMHTFLAFCRPLSHYLLLLYCYFIRRLLLLFDPLFSLLLLLLACGMMWDDARD